MVIIQWKNVRTIIHIPKTGNGTNKVMIPTELLWQISTINRKPCGVGQVNFYVGLPPHCSPPPIIELDLFIRSCGTNYRAQLYGSRNRNPIHFPHWKTDRPTMSSEEVKRWCLLPWNAALLTIIKQDPPIRERENQPWKWEQISFCSFASEATDCPFP